MKKLTDREFDVLREIVDGISNKKIAQKLKITERTVEKHTSSILDKLGVNSRAEAVVAAVAENLA